MSLPPPASFTWQRKRGRCKIALTCYLLIAVMLVRNAQAGVIKKREIPSATGMDMGETTAATPANFLVSSIRAVSADPDIEVGELNRTQALPTKLTPLDSHDSGMPTKLQPMGRGFGTSSQEQAMANEIALLKNPSSIDSSPEFEKKLQESISESTLKIPAQQSLNEENSNETPRRAPVATENPILKLASNLGQNFQEKIEGLSGQVLHSLNDIGSRQTTQENAKEIDSGTKINPILAGNINSENIMVLTPQSKEKSDDVPTKIVGKDMDLAAQANLSQDVEVMTLGPDNRPVLSVSSTHENLANLADTQESHKEEMGNSGDTSQKAFAAESGKDTQEFPLKGDGNSQESHNVGATNDLNSQESLRTKNPETNSGKNNENPLESYILKVDNEIPSKDNENPPGSPNKIPQESQNGDRGNSLHSQESQGAESAHGGISQESQNTLMGNVQENPIKIQEIPSNAQENPIKNQGIPKNVQESRNSPENLHYTTTTSNINDVNSPVSQNTPMASENPQNSQNAKENSQNVRESSSDSASDNGSDQLSQTGSTFQNVNTNPQNSENIHENPQESQNSKENLQKSPIVGENSQESPKAENIQESQNSLATTNQGNLQESQNTLENNDSVAKDSQNANENPQTSPQTEQNSFGNSPNATETPQESPNTLEINASLKKDSQNTNENLHTTQKSGNNENTPNDSKSQITLKISSNAEGNTMNELASHENEGNLEGKSSPENSVKEIDEKNKNNGNSGDFLTSTKPEEETKSFKVLEENHGNHNLNEISSKETLLASGKSGKEESHNLPEKDGNPDEKLGLNGLGNQELKTEETTTKSPHTSAIENNLQRKASDLEAATADRSNHTADLSKTTTLRDNSLESNHINAESTATIKSNESVFSSKVIAGGSENKFLNTSGHIQDALDSDSWKEVTNDLPDRTTEKAPEAIPSPKPMDKVEYGRSMFGNGEKMEEEEESTTLPAHIANNLDFEELQKNSSSQRPKQPKFINENSSNAQQMNLPNNPEVWSLAGMKNPNSNSNFNLELPKITTTEKGLAIAEKSQEMREPFESEKSQQGLNEKSLLDWSHIITDKDLLQATTEQYEGMELLGNSSTNKISANSEILSMAGEDDKAVKMGETKDNLPTQVAGGEESATTESFVEFVASPKSVGTHEQQQQQQPDTNLTLTQQQPANTTAVASDEPGAVITFENNPREQSFINHNNLTDSEREPVTKATAVITESSHSQPEVQKTTVESNINSFVEPFAESTTITVPTTTRNSVSDDFGIKANITENSNAESSGEENNSRFPEVTTYKPKFVITTKTTTETETETATTSPANEAEPATTKTIPLAEVIDQNGIDSNSHDNELQQKQQQQSINIETTTTTTSLDTTTLASQEPSAEVTGAAVLASSFEGQFSSTNKTHLNEQLVANITTTTTQATTTTTSTTDIPFEATSSTPTTITEAKENTTSSSTKEIIKKLLEEATTTPSPSTQQEAKEATQPGETGQEEQEKNNSQEQIKITTTEQNIIIGLPYTTTTEVSATKEEEKATKEQEATKEEEKQEEKKEEDTKKEIETITTTAVPILATETPVVGHSTETHTTTSTPELNTTQEGEEGATTEKGVETYFKFPLRGGNQKPAATTTTPLPEIITTTTQAAKREEEAEVEGSGGGEYAEGVELTTMSLPESTTTTSTSTSTTAVTEETFISLLDDSTTTTTTTTTTSIPPIIIKTTTTAAETTTEASSSTTTTTTLKGLEEEVYKIISNSSATAGSPKTTTTSEIPHTTLIDYLETTTTTAMIPTTTSNSTTTTMVIQTANIGGTGGNSLPPLDTIMIPNGGDNNMFTKNSNDSGETDVNVIIAITVSVIGVVALILLVAFLYLMRKRQKQTSYSQRCRPVSLDEYAIENGSIGGGSIRKGSAFRSSKRTYGNLAFDDPSIRHNALGVHDLAKFATEKLRIFEEFRDVPQITARDDEVPPGVEDKNRYANVLPLPETRVILQRLNDDEKTEYINANYVSGPKDSPNYYIACQAPLETTVEDFWRMIWEQQSRVIIQATDLIENGIEKCFEYLPPSVTLDNHATFGDFQVTLQNREVKDKYAISTILLKNTAENNASRELTHYWYKWPETGVPVEEAPIIAMLLEARSSLISYAIEQANEEKEKSSAPGAGNTLRSAEEGGATNGVKDGTNSNGSSNAEINGNISMVPIKKTARNQGPLTVHCSPGTGRTGTIIACDIAIRSLETPKRTVDIPHIVYYVRRGRASAVLTKEQYEFIYKVANMYAAKITNPSNYN